MAHVAHQPETRHRRPFSSLLRGPCIAASSPFCSVPVSSRVMTTGFLQPLPGPFSLFPFPFFPFCSSWLAIQGSLCTSKTTGDDRLSRQKGGTDGWLQTLQIDRSTLWRDRNPLAPHACCVRCSPYHWSAKDRRAHPMRIKSARSNEVPTGFHCSMEHRWTGGMTRSTSARSLVGGFPGVKEEPVSTTSLLAYLAPVFHHPSAPPRTPISPPRIPPSTTRRVLEAWLDGRH